MMRTLRSLAAASVQRAERSRQLLDKHQPSAVFSLGGYAAGPVVLAALWKHRRWW